MPTDSRLSIAALVGALAASQAASPLNETAAEAHVDRGDLAEGTAGVLQRQHPFAGRG